MLSPDRNWRKSKLARPAIVTLRGISGTEDHEDDQQKHVTLFTLLHLPNQAPLRVRAGPSEQSVR